MRRLSLIVPASFVMLALACSRETPAPPSTDSAPATQSASPKPVITTTSIAAPAAEKGTYDEAMMWLKSTPGFRFTLEDHGVSSSGEMKRPHIGTEVVTFRANGSEWRGEAGPRGLVWSKRSGNTWKESATPPEYAGRLFQRVTFAFDPQKIEGSAQLAASEATSNLYRYTDANTGEVHEVRVNKHDAHIESMKTGDTVSLTITP